MKREFTNGKMPDSLPDGEYVGEIFNGVITIDGYTFPVKSPITGKRPVICEVKNNQVINFGVIGG